MQVNLVVSLVCTSDSKGSYTMTFHSFLSSATSTCGGSWAVGLLLFVGAIQGLKALVRFASGIYVYYLRPGKNLKRLGQWAVVTGATDGIGRAYADGLAKKGEFLKLYNKNDDSKVPCEVHDVHSDQRAQLATCTCDPCSCEFSGSLLSKAHIKFIQKLFSYPLLHLIPPAPRLNSSLPFTQESGCLDLVWGGIPACLLPSILHQTFQR